MDKAVKVMNFIIKSQPMTKDDSAEIEHMIHMTHEFVLFYIWNYIDIPILIARYYKKWNYAYRIHSIIGTLALVANILICTCQVLRVRIKQSHFLDENQWHYIPVISMFVMSFFQGIGGSILETVYLAKNNRSPGLKVFLRYLHLTTGMGMYLAGKYVIYGTIQHDWLESDYSPIQFHYPTLQFYLMLMVTVAVVSFMEMKNCLDKATRGTVAARIALKGPKGLHSKQFTDPEGTTPKQKKVMEMLRRGASVKELRQDFPDMTVFLYQNCVYDLTGYRHPGGAILFKHHNFMEVSRYMLGTHADEKLNTGQHLHDHVAFSIMDDRFIGLIVDPSDTHQEKDQWTLIDPRTERITFVNYEFKVEEVRRISKKMYIIKMFSPKAYIKMNLKGIAWIGKHFYVHNNKSKLRPYTTAVCLSDESAEYRKSLLEIFHQRDKLSGDQNLDSLKIDFPSYSESLYFCVRPHNTGDSISSMLANSQQHQAIKLQGPFGKGLDLQENYCGRCVILTLGTGYLPFLDLFEFLFKKALYLIMKKEGYENMTHLVKPEQNYEEILKGASFEFYGSFHSSEDFAGADWMNELYMLDKEYDLGMFNSKVRFKKRETHNIKIPLLNSMINKQFLRKLLFENKMNKVKLEDGGSHLSGEMVSRAWDREVDRLFVCGTPEFMKNVSTMCEQLGFPEGRVFFV
jgi:NAD(P)H-flavin reductase